MATRPPEQLLETLRRSVAARQAQRLPSVVAAVVREGEVIWSGGAGLADCEGGIEAHPDSQYRVGSITKLFTTVAVMLLRDEGKLALDDPLERHLPGLEAGGVTLRRMLAHRSGLQRETGEMFVSGTAPTSDDLLRALASYEQVLPAARAHHYSNLAFALLGEVVARRSGTPYTSFVDERILAPLGLARTTWFEQPPRAQGYLVDEYAGTVGREPHSDMRAVASMGQLWSTVGDLCRFASFLAGSGDGILPAATLEEMWTPQVLVDPEHWSVGWGLGLELASFGERVYGGHGGAMPGFLAGLHIHRGSRVGAAVLTNSGTRLATRELCLELAAATIDAWPSEIRPWQPEHEPPAEVRALLGRWWSEGAEFVLCWREGKLTAELPGAPSWVHPSVFEPLEDGSYRVVSGRERGERLRVEGERLVFAGYSCSRNQALSAG